MIRGGFLSVSQRMELLALLRSGRSEQRLARRANVLLLLDDGWSCEKLAEALYLDDDTLRGWRKTYDGSGLLGLERARKTKGSVKTRRMLATWSPDFLLQVLNF